MRDFNDQQQRFVDAMGKGLSGDFNSGGKTSEALLLIGGLVLFIFLLFLLIQNGRKLRGKFRFWGRLVTGKTRPVTRKRVKLPITMELPSGPLRTTHTETADVSARGIFVKLNPPLKVGDHFFFIMTLGPNKLKAYAQVRWVQERWNSDRPAGMGCQFLNLPDEEQKKLLVFLRSIK